jgi:DNA ligase-1
MRREFLQLAETLNAAKHNIGGYYMSSKLDGMRAAWDGGITRSMRTEDVPWASVTDPKTGKKKTKIKPIATGLWSRYGNPIMAPDWFLNRLPACFLDGELWAGEGNFQLCRSICAGDDPDPRFDKIKYAVYSAPSFQSLFQDGEIKNTNMVCQISEEECGEFIGRQLEDFEGDFRFSVAKTFEEEVAFLKTVFESENASCFMLKQETLPLDLGQAHIRVAEYLDYVLEQKGEGVVLRNPLSCWKPRRHNGILKYKPYLDAEATIVGYTSGRETTKGSRLLGKIGALIVDYAGKRLELSGLTDAEREFADQMARDWAANNPGVDAPYWVEGKQFKKGQTISFKYRELTDDGVPKEARYWRRRDAE